MKRTNKKEVERMKRTKRGISLLLALVFIASLFSGCNSAEKEPEAVTPTTQATATTPATSIEQKEPLNGKLVFWHSFAQEARQEVMSQMAKNFENENPGVTIEIEVLPWNSFDDKWKVGKNTGLLPDVSSVLPDVAFTAASYDLLTPMDEIVDEIGRDKFYEGPLKIMTMDGNLIALPFYNHARVLWYRKDLLEEKGIAPPETFDELMEAAKAVHNPPEVYGMPMPSKTSDGIGPLWLYVFAKNMGENLVTPDGRSNLNTQGVIDALQYYADMYKVVSPQETVNWGDSETNDAFNMGKSAFFMQSSFTLSNINSANPELLDKIGALPPPVKNKGDKAEFMAEYVCFALWKNSKHPEAAKEFLLSLYETDNYVKFLHLVPGGMIPILKEVAESEAYLNNPIIQSHNADIQVSLQGISVGSPVAADYGFNAAIPGAVQRYGIVEEMLQTVMQGKATAAEAAAAADKKLNKQIDEIWASVK